MMVGEATHPAACAGGLRPAMAPQTIMLDELEIAAPISSFWMICGINSAYHHADDPKALTMFHSSVLPPITLLDYVTGIMVRCSSGSQIVKVAIILVARFCKAVNMLPSVLSAHRLILVAMLIANKMHHDRPRRNKDFAFAGGVAVPEICGLEARMCRKLDYRLVVSPDEFAALDDLTSRGLFTLFTVPGMNPFAPSVSARGVPCDAACQTEPISPILAVDRETQTALRPARRDSADLATQCAPATLVTFLGSAGIDGFMDGTRRSEMEPPPFHLPPQCVVDCGNQTLSRCEEPYGPDSLSPHSHLSVVDSSMAAADCTSKPTKFASLRRLSSSTSPSAYSAGERTPRAITVRAE